MAAIIKNKNKRFITVGLQPIAPGAGIPLDSIGQTAGILQNGICKDLLLNGEQDDFGLRFFVHLFFCKDTRLQGDRFTDFCLYSTNIAGIQGPDRIVGRISNYRLQEKRDEGEKTRLYSLEKPWNTASFEKFRSPISQREREN
jgi:hypothetical protein